MSRLKIRAKFCPTSPWVFAREDGSRIKAVKKSFKTTCRRSEIEDFHIRDLRSCLVKKLPSEKYLNRADFFDALRRIVVLFNEKQRKNTPISRALQRSSFLTRQLLRHTCAAWLVGIGVPLAEVHDLPGHASVVVTERHAHLSPDNVRAAVAKLDEPVSRFGHTDTKQRKASSGLFAITS